MLMFLFSQIIYYCQWSITAADIATFLFMALSTYGVEETVKSPIIVDEDAENSTSLWVKEIDFYLNIIM